MPFTTSSQEAEQALFLQPRNPHGANHLETRMLVKQQCHWNFQHL